MVVCTHMSLSHGNTPSFQSTPPPFIFPNPPQYQAQALILPSPPVRPTFGPLWDMSVFDHLPTRDACLTTRFQLFFKHFLHVAVVGTDREKRPVWGGGGEGVRGVVGAGGVCCRCRWCVW